MLALCKTHTEIKKLLKSPLKWAYYVLKREAVIMGTVSTSDETKQEYIKQMGEELGLLFYALWKEITWLHLKWHEYVTLFGTKSSRIELLNDVAPLFFRIVQDSLWDDILLHIARTTDPPKSSGKKNLIIRRLASLVTDEEVASILKKNNLIL